MRRKHLLPLLAWTILWFAFFATILLGTQRLPTSDFSEQFHASTLFQAREMAQGRLPLWSAHSYGGVPFVADPQTAVFYLPRWLTIFLSLPWGFPFYALELEVLLHVWLAGVFTYFLAYDLTRNRAASLLGAVVFALGGYLVSYPLLQLAILETMTWLPLVLLLLRKGVQSANGRSLRWFILAGLVLALSTTAGHPQTFLHVAYTAAAYYFFLTIRARWQARWIALFGSVIATVALITAAVYWLPVTRFYLLSTRAAVDYDFVSTGQPMLHYLQLVAPAVFSGWSPEYIGLAGLVLALFAWLARKIDREQTAEITFWAVFIFVASWLALGHDGILFQLVYHIAPGFSLFRQQERLLGVVSLGGALLAAQGLALWLRFNLPQRRHILRQVAWICAVLFGGTLVILVGTRSVPQANWPIILGRQVGITAVVLALLWSNHWRQGKIVLLLLLLGGDLYLGTAAGIARYNGSPANYWIERPWLPDIWAEYETPGRLDSRRVFWANVGEVYGWEDISGISPLMPQALADFEKLPDFRRWQLLNVTHVIDMYPVENDLLTSLEYFEGGVIEDRPRTFTLYRFDAALPHAWMSYEPLVIADDEAALAQLAQPDFDPAQQVILPQASETVSPPPREAAALQVAVTSQRSGQLHVEVETAVPGHLVISEWFHPGWRATLDGEPVTLQRADVYLQAVYLPAGSHRIELRFQPMEVTVGIVLSLLALVLAGLVAWRWQPTLVIGMAGWHWPSWGRSGAVGRERPLSRNTYFWLALLLIFLGFSLRLFRLDYQELRGDEGISYGYALNSAAEIVTSLRDNGNPHSPLHYLLLHFWMGVMGESEFALRYISLLPGLLALPLAYQLGKRMVGRRLGLLLAGLMATSQALVWISQDVRNQYTLTIAFSLAATLAFLTALQRQRWQWWLLYTLLAALTMYAHTYGLFVLLAHGAYLLAASTSFKTWLAWVGSGLVALLLFLPWLVFSLPAMISVGGHFDRPTTPELARHLTEVGVELGIGSAMTPAVGRWLLLAFLLLIGLGVRYLWERKRPLTILLLTWLIGAALGIYLIRFSRDTFNTYYMTVAGPAWWALVSAGLLSIWQQRSRWWGRIGLLAVLGMAAVSLSNYYFQPEYSRSSGYREAVAALTPSLRANDVIVTNYPDASLSYYLRHLETPRTMQPDVFQNSNEQAVANLKQLANQYDRLWFFPVHRSNWDPEDVAFNWLEANLVRERESTFDQITFAAYRPLDHTAEIMPPMAWRVGETIELRGAYLTVNGRPYPLRQDDPITLPENGQLELSLVWATDEVISESLTVFVHILAEDGRLLAQHDGIPANGTRPTPLWPVNEPILDKHRLTLPEGLTGQKANLVIGLYDSQTIERKLFADGNDHFWLANVNFTVGE